MFEKNEITLINDKTNKSIKIKIGFSFLLFFTSIFFGIPLFLRRLYKLGFIMLALVGINIYLFLEIVIVVGNIAIQNKVITEEIMQQIAASTSSYFLLIFVFSTILHMFLIFLGYKGNEITAKAFLNDGYKFETSSGTRIENAKVLWDISVPSRELNNQINIRFINITTGDSKNVRVGFSLLFFIFSPFFGIPFFLKRLYNLGFMMFGLCAIYYLATYFSMGIFVNLFFSIVIGVLSIFFGIKGNEITAKIYLASGYIIENENSSDAKIAKIKWGLVR